MSSLISEKMPPSAVTGAMEAFANGQLEEFDALVGDTACQIRAAKVCDLAQNLRKLSEEDKAFLVNCYFLNPTSAFFGA